MTYENTLDIDFEHKGKHYGVTASCTVELTKRDIGPEGYQEHLWRYVADKVHLEDIIVGDVDTGEDLDQVPPDLLAVVNDKLTEKAEEMSERDCSDE